MAVPTYRFARADLRANPERYLGKEKIITCGPAGSWQDGAGRVLGMRFAFYGGGWRAKPPPMAVRVETENRGQARLGANGRASLEPVPIFARARYARPYAL